jgi:hypothetical protein
LAYQQDEHWRETAREAEAEDTGNGDAGGGWATVRDAAEQVGRSVDWVRRQCRSGTVDSRMRAGRHGPERLVDLDALRAVATARTDSPSAGSRSAPLPVLAETVHELARQLGEVQERAARAEADAEELRQRLADVEQAADINQAADAGPPVAGPVPDLAERHVEVWLAANRQYLRTLPGAAAREAAGARLAGGRSVEPAPRSRPWRRRR